MTRVLVNTVSLSSGALVRERHIVGELTKRDGPHEYEVLATPATCEALGSQSETVRLHEVPAPEGTAERIWWENKDLRSHANRLDADLLYFPLHITNFINSFPKVSAVRNAAPFYPEAHAGASARERLRLWALWAATRRTIAQSEAVLFFSEATYERVTRSIPGAAEKGVVVPHGIPLGFEPIKPNREIYYAYNLPDRFLLSVSNIARYKNLLELVDGYAVAREQVDLPPLCLAGKVVDAGYERELRDLIAAHRLQDSFRLLGCVDHGDLPQLHSACDLFVFSSACENSPVTLVEALACGDAIACSNVASMPELCGDAAAYFDPYNPTDIGATVADLWSDEQRRKRLETAALRRAETFEWAEATEKISSIFTSVTREGRV